MHICNRNVDYEVVIMRHWNVGLKKINNLNLRNPIWTLDWNKIPYITTFDCLNNRSNEWMKDLGYSRERFDWYGIWKKLKYLFLPYYTNKYSFYNFLWGPLLDIHQCSLWWGVSMVDKLQYVKPQVWIDQIWNKFLQEI